MIKRRLGDDFATSISANLEIKAHEARRDAKGGKRGGKPRDNKERKPREPKEEKKEDKPAATEEAAKAEEPKK